MRRVGSVLIILGIVLAVLAAFSVFLILSGTQPQPVQVATAKVVIAFQDITERSEIAPEQVGAVDWPATIPTPIGAFEKPSDASGKLSVIHIYPGQPIVDKMVIDKGDLRELHSNAALLLEKGTVAIAIPVSLNTNVAEAIQAGDRVDLIGTFNVQPITGTVSSQTNLGLPVIQTQRLLQDVLVLQVGAWPSSTPQQGQTAKIVVTLQVPMQDALVAKFAQLNASDLSLALRAANDHELVDPTPVSIDYIEKHFGYNFHRLIPQ